MVATFDGGRTGGGVAGPGGAAHALLGRRLRTTLAPLVGETSGRYTLLDPLRLLASFAVVRNHVRGDYLFGVGIGLFLFLVILFGLNAGSSREEPVLGFARRKARYLLVPWVRWSLFYVALSLVWNLAEGKPLTRGLRPDMVLFGGHVSLWFLPFAAAALAGLACMRSLVRGVARVQLAVAMALVAALGSHSLGLLLDAGVSSFPERAWMRALPGLFWGFAVGSATRIEGVRDRSEVLVLIALLAVLTRSLSPRGDGADEILLRFAVAVPLACLGFLWRPPIPFFVRRLASLTFGIYLLHPLVERLLRTSFEVASWPVHAHVLGVWVLSGLGILGLRCIVRSWPECGPRVLPDRVRA